MTFIKNISFAMKKYSFLLYELVMRDFKVKYKRSILGVFWSLLYPILMMTVLSLVFSKVFRMTVPGVSYLVYLITGLIFFNYYTEASTIGMGSICANFGLINKVYIPKYIFPLSKCIFTGINFMLSLIPLYGVILLTGTGVNIYHLLLPYSYICLFVFTLGMTLLLSSTVVFFRDLSYIYGIVTMIWMYFTPIMYDISIISTRYSNFFKLNPLYQYINFAREIVLYSRCPSWQDFLFSFLSAFVALIIGATVFRKTQDQFVYYI